MSYIRHIRSLMGPSKIFLAFAGVIVRDGEGRVLLQRRSDFDAWGIPGGALELGESIVNCARRELLEETGHTVGPLDLVGVYSEPQLDVMYPNGDQVQQYTIAFQGTTRGAPAAYDSAETTELRFFSPTCLPVMPMWYEWMLADAVSGDGPAFRPPATEPMTLPQVPSIRSVIGSAPYIGAGVTGIVVGDEERILVARGNGEDEWHFPGGYLDLGENAAAAVVRLIHDKTGLDVVPEQLLGIQSEPDIRRSPNGDETQSVNSIFQCRVVGSEGISDGDETAGIAWLTREELALLGLDPVTSRLRKAVLDHLYKGWFVIP